MRSSFRFASPITVIVAIFILAAPAAAADQWTTFKQSGTNALAFNDTCSENADGTVTCQGQSIHVFEGTIRQTGEPTSSGEQVCYSEHHVIFDPSTEQAIESRALFGCAFEAGTLTVDGLNSIILAPTIVELTEVVCDGSDCVESAAGSISVHGTWTGEGPTMSQRGKFRFDDGACIGVNADKSTTRMASFDGSITALQARIGDGSFTFKTSCPL